mmetsp:Transcript_9466/g.20839  ORF Transcript_9466/g.20839 Transcript_9466/m.20839 type:complete len:222 (-) Transcript_9466:1850-2515(-)
MWIPSAAGKTRSANGAPAAARPAARGIPCCTEEAPGALSAPGRRTLGRRSGGSASSSRRAARSDSHLRAGCRSQTRWARREVRTVANLLGVGGLTDRVQLGQRGTHVGEAKQAEGVTRGGPLDRGVTIYDFGDTLVGALDCLSPKLQHGQLAAQRCRSESRSALGLRSSLDTDRASLSLRPEADGLRLCFGSGDPGVGVLLGADCSHLGFGLSCLNLHTEP